MARLSRPFELLRFQLPGDQSNERVAADRVAEVAHELGISSQRLERLKTAVAEATMNAIEHGNRNRPDLPVEISMSASDEEMRVIVADHGGGPPSRRIPRSPT